jgi:hypothetical protein
MLIINIQEAHTYSVQIKVIEPIVKTIYKILSIEPEQDLVSVR